MNMISKIKDEYRLIYKFKNRKLGLEIQQKQEKNLTENDNMNKQSYKILNQKLQQIRLGTFTNQIQNNFFRVKATPEQ